MRGAPNNNNNIQGFEYDANVGECDRLEEYNGLSSEEQHSIETFNFSDCFDPSLIERDVGKDTDKSNPTSFYDVVDVFDVVDDFYVFDEVENNENNTIDEKNEDNKIFGKDNLTSDPNDDIDKNKSYDNNEILNKKEKEEEKINKNKDKKNKKNKGNNKKSRRN